MQTSARMDGGTVIISGAARGLGREYALYFARLGARLVLNDLHGPGAVADEVAALGAEVLAHCGDVSTWDGASALIDLAASRFGRIDTLVNNAALLRVTPARRMTREDWEVMLGANLMTTIAPTHAAIQFWNGEEAAGRSVRASILNMTSENALAAYPGRPAYTAGKAGVAALTVSLSQELASLGVRVNALSPSARTPMSQQTAAVIERMRKPEEAGALDRYDPTQVAPFVAWLSLPDCPVTGCVYRVMGGSITRYVGWQRGPEIITASDWRIEDFDALMMGKMIVPEEGGDPALRANALAVAAGTQ